MARTRVTKAEVVRYGGRQWDTAQKGKLCSIRGCSHIRDGYMTVIRPDEANTNGRLWYAPICADCCKPLLCDPIPLGHIMYQKGGSAGAALALDVSIEVIHARLVAEPFEGITA